MRDRFHWARLLAFVTGLVNQELLLRNEYLVAENRILRAHLPSRLRLSDAGRSTLAESGRRVSLGGITRHPDSCWMEQVARNATMEGAGYLNGCRYLLHDRDKKFRPEFRETLVAGGVKGMPIPARSPNLNAHAERWVRSIKEECLSKLILFGETSLRRVVSEYLDHYHQERNYQGKGNLLLFPTSTPRAAGPHRLIRCRERLGGLLKHYIRAA